MYDLASLSVALVFPMVSIHDLASLSVALVFPMVSIHTNKRYRKLKGQSRMNSPKTVNTGHNRHRTKTLATLGTIDTGQRHCQHWAQ